MEKPRSERNRTIILTEADKAALQPSLSKIDAACTASDIIGKTINQNLFDIIEFLPEGFADLLVIDPPYNLSKDFAGMKFKATNNDSYTEYIRSWLPKIVRCLKPDGSLYVCCDWKSSSAVFQVLDSIAIIKNRITWQREKGRGALRNWKNAMEDIWFAVMDADNYYFDVEAVKMKRRVIAPYKVDGKPKDWEETEDGNFRLTHPSNFWDDISIPYWSMPENTEHPTQKPEKLIAKLILASCPEGGVVFDPFLGSGTTSVVAKKLGRLYCGIEINHDYALLAAKRLAMADEDKSIQGYSGGVFWERNTLNLQNRANNGKRKSEKSITL